MSLFISNVRGCLHVVCLFRKKASMRTIAQKHQSKTGLKAACRPSWFRKGCHATVIIPRISGLRWCDPCVVRLCYQRIGHLRSCNLPDSKQEKMQARARDLQARKAQQKEAQEEISLTAKTKRCLLVRQEGPGLTCSRQWSLCTPTRCRTGAPSCQPGRASSLRRTECSRRSCQHDPEGCRSH